MRLLHINHLLQITIVESILNIQLEQRPCHLNSNREQNFDGVQLSNGRECLKIIHAIGQNNL